MAPLGEWSLEATVLVGARGMPGTVALVNERQDGIFREPPLVIATTFRTAEKSPKHRAVRNVRRPLEPARAARAGGERGQADSA